MCGILGWIAYGKNRPSFNEVETMFLDNESRGGDATGMAYFNQANKIIVHKAPVSATEFVKSKTFRAMKRQGFPMPRIFIGHTRARTKGSQANAVNNHPIYLKESGLAMVHNGIISNDDWVFKKLKMPRQGEVDSEVLLRIIERNDTYAKGLKEIDDECAGSGAIAVLNEKMPDALMLARDTGRPIKILADRKRDILFFSSQESAFDATFKSQGLVKDWYGMKVDASELNQNEVKPEGGVLLTLEKGLVEKYTGLKMSFEAWKREPVKQWTGNFGNRRSKGNKKKSKKHRDMEYHPNKRWDKTHQCWVWRDGMSPTEIDVQIRKDMAEEDDESVIPISEIEVDGEMIEVEGEYDETQLGYLYSRRWFDLDNGKHYGDCPVCKRLKDLKYIHKMKKGMCEDCYVEMKVKQERLRLERKAIEIAFERTQEDTDGAQEIDKEDPLGKVNSVIKKHTKFWEHTYDEPKKCDFCDKDSLTLYAWGPDKEFCRECHDEHVDTHCVVCLYEKSPHDLADMGEGGKICLTCFDMSLNP